MLLTRESFDLIAGDPDTPEGNVVLVQLAKYGEIREVAARPGGPVYREAFMSMHLADNVAVKSSHTGEQIGHLDASTFREMPDPTAELVIADTAAGRDVLALIRNDTIKSVSVEFAPDTSADVRRADGTIERHNAKIGNVAFAFRPAHSSPVLAMRDQPEEILMESHTPTVEGSPDLLTRENVGEMFDEFRRDLIASQPAAPADEYAQLREYDSIGSMFLAAYDDPELSGLLCRALADQTTGNNPGVILPTDIQTIAGIINGGRPSISAFGVTGLPPSGMSIEFPFFAGDLSALVGEQITEKTDITSVQVDIEQGTSPIRTFAGGSDISLQLVRRSSPSYVSAYLEIMAAAYALFTDTAMVAGAVAAGTAGLVWDPAADSIEDLVTVYFTESVAIEAATGRPAEFVLAATDVYIAIGTAQGTINTSGPQNPRYGTQNVPGLTDARGLQVEIHGLPVIHVPGATAGDHVVSNSLAASWHEDGPSTIQALDVEKLGNNVAVWGMGNIVSTLPNGIVNIPAV